MKRVYVTCIFHGNMQYDRWPREFIRENFPRIYEMVIDDLLRFPELKCQIQLSGVTILSLERCAPALMEKFKALVARGQVAFTGTYYSEPLNICLDGSSDLECARLGTEIARRTFGEPSGFFPQEQCYHPQLPFIVDRLGLKWMTIYDTDARRRTAFRLRGLDGTEIVGVPVYGISRYSLGEQLESLWDEAKDGDLFTFVGDFELPPSIPSIVGEMRRLEGIGKRIEFTTIDSYLDGRSIGDEAFYTPCSWTESQRSPSFVRWTADPEDIRIHTLAMRAFEDFRSARMMDAFARLGPEARRALPRLSREPSVSEIEAASDFPEVEESFLAPELRGTALGKALHLLLWGTNSDATGWYPHVEKRKERSLSFADSSAISSRIVSSGIEAEAAGLGGGDQGLSLAVFNPAMARRASVVLENDLRLRPLDEGVDYEFLRSGERYLTRMTLDLPAFGLRTVPVEPCFDEARTRGPSIGEGCSISGDGLTLRAEGEELVVSRGAETVLRCGLEPIGPFDIRETHRGRIVHRSPYAWGKVETYIDDGEERELVVARRIDYCINYQIRYSISGGALRCRIELDFDKELMIGGGNSAIDTSVWFPKGLSFLLRGAGPGKARYDLPYASVEHPYDSESYVAIGRYVALQEESSGFAVVLSTGAKCVRLDPARGLVGIGLGASTMGTPEEPSTHIIDLESRNVTQINRWEEEAFIGRYEYEFHILPYVGTWRESDVPRKAMELRAPVYSRIIAGGVEGRSRSFIGLEADGVSVARAYKGEDGKVYVDLVEEFGEAKSVGIEIEGRRIEADLRPFQVKTVALS